MKKRVGNDIILISLCLALAVLFIILMRICADNGTYVSVSVDGVETARYLLSENTEAVIGKPDGDYNILIIKDGFAYISQASCPDKLCVHFKPIHLANQSITCLPNKTVVTVLSSDGEVDIVQ